jgi:opacity protein-like surface antigen
MRKFVLLVGMLLLVAGSAAAQETPWSELFFGYTLIHANGGSSSSSLAAARQLEGSGAQGIVTGSSGSSTTNIHGASFSVAGNLNSWMGIVADVGSGSIDDSGLSGNIFTYMFGPRISYRHHDRFTPFGQVLVGGARLRVNVPSAGNSNTTLSAWAVAFGGGLDVKLSEHFAIRAIQAEYLMTRFGSESQNNARVSVGLVLRLGKR